MIETTRRERQRQANREGILRATLNIVELEGWSAVTIRKIADEIGYASPIIYQHFANKEAVLQTLIQQGYNELQATMQRTAQAAAPEGQLLEPAKAYLRFAHDHPRVYELMHGLGGASPDPQVRVAAAAGVIALTTAAIGTWANARGVRLMNPLAAETVWGVLHGMASLSLIPDVGPERAEQLALNALEALLVYWEVNAGRTFSPPYSINDTISTADLIRP